MQHLLELRIRQLFRSCQSMSFIAQNITIQGVKGSEGLGYALTHPSSRLLTLDLKMNTNLGSAGAAHLATALLRGSVLQKYTFYYAKS